MTQPKEADLNDVEAAIEKWGDTVLRLAYCRLRNHADAEDVFQNVFLSLHRAHPTFSSNTHQKAWLLRTTCNCCNDVGRQRRARTAIDIDGIDVIDPTTEGDELARQIEEALEALTDKQRTAVHLRYFEGYSAEQIAHITGEKPATVRSHLFRARQALKIELTLEGEAPCVKTTLCTSIAPHKSA